jgi:hypothetical protein
MFFPTFVCLWCGGGGCFVVVVVVLLLLLLFCVPRWVGLDFFSGLVVLKFKKTQTHCRRQGRREL